MCQSGLPDSCGLQQVEANVGVDPDPLRQHLGEFGRHRGEVRQAGGRVCLPDPEEGAIRVTKENKIFPRVHNCSHNIIFTVWDNLPPVRVMLVLPLTSKLSSLSSKRTQSDKSSNQTTIILLCAKYHFYFISVEYVLKVL